MIAFPHAKINIGLNILSKRMDGYHNLQTIFYPVALNDALEIIDGNEQETGIEFTCTGLPVNGNINDNLCVTAYELLRKDFPQITAIKGHLHKIIPMGAGMGGGSADAAFMLRLLNNKFQLNLSIDQLIDYALQLGSDCPFFILNKACFATGRGEIMQPVNIDLRSYNILIVNPGIHVNTASAFSQITPGENSTELQSLIMHQITTWKHSISNDFEKPVFAKYPEIAEIKNNLYDAGAIYASMSGSGSTVYGIFSGTEKPAINFPAHYFCHWV